MTIATLGLIWKILVAFGGALFCAGVIWCTLKFRNKNIEDRLEIGNTQFSDLREIDKKTEERLVKLENLTDNFKANLKNLQTEVENNKKYCTQKFKDLHVSICDKIDELKEIITVQNKVYGSYIEKSKVYQGGIISVLSIVIAHINQDTDFSDGKNEGLRSLVESASRKLERLDDKLGET